MTSNVEIKAKFAHFTTVDGYKLRMHYREAYVSSNLSTDKIVILLHGFPQTSYQFRYVLIPLAELGYRVIAPDYRGAGQTSRPPNGYQKVIMASDIDRLLDNLQITPPVHLVGHDIGGMIAVAFAQQYPQKLKTLTWGEACIPGSSFYERSKFSIEKFHFLFHRLPDGLAERLVAGNEDFYIQQFFDRLLFNSDGIQSQDLQVYVNSYRQTDAMRAAMEIYRAFEEDAQNYVNHLQSHGQCSVPTLILDGAQSDHRFESEDLGKQFHTSAVTDTVAESGHYIAEENPEAFVNSLLKFWDSEIPNSL
ncbi:hypothetical protein L7F22_019930 [Adiantum nelumboides]|nr:hypothetical protein [Adiantum nelumboides]